MAKTQQTFNHYVRSGSKMLRLGITTGCCAALAAKAAAALLLDGKAPNEASVLTRRGIEVTRQLEGNGILSDGGAWASVRKDAGDDPDVTDGIEIVATLYKSASPGIRTDGGRGVGRVKKPGLQQPVGAAAINNAPRRMIEEAVQEVCDARQYFGGMDVVISAPQGEEIAKKTFNPTLGIEGGISILGTTGIEYPMSEDAIIKSIEVELHQAAVLSNRVIITPGSYGEAFIQENDLNPRGLPVVRFSGYLGETLDALSTEDVADVLLVSHIGKLVKTAGGIMNTHQKNADCRMELITAHAAICGASTAICRELMAQTTTDGCIAVLDEAGLRAAVMASLMGAIDKSLKRRVDGAYGISAVMFSNRYGILGRTDA